jgi:hypothetical protein
MGVTAPKPAARALALPRDSFLLALILLGSAALRLVNLDYSHFQGDEISALYPIGVPFPGALLEQLKGPIQLLVTLVVRLISGGYGEWETRLPFSLASLLGVYVVYLFVRDSFGRRAALLAAALAGSCGLLVAFGRIAQYQAFVMLAVSLSAWLLMRWVQRDEPRFLYLGLASYLGSPPPALAFLPAFFFWMALGFRRRSADVGSLPPLVTGQPHRRHPDGRLLRSLHPPSGLLIGDSLSAWPRRRRTRMGDVRPNPPTSWTLLASALPSSRHGAGGDRAPFPRKNAPQDGRRPGLPPFCFYMFWGPAPVPCVHGVSG